MKSVSIYDLRDNLASYLTMVDKNDMSIIVNRFSKPIAVLVPYTDNVVPSPDRFFGFLGKKGERGDRAEARIRRNTGERRRTEAFHKRTA
jgi:prevent-host-death family protein